MVIPPFCRLNNFRKSAKAAQLFLSNFLHKVLLYRRGDRHSPDFRNPCWRRLCLLRGHEVFLGFPASDKDEDDSH